MMIVLTYNYIDEKKHKSVACQKFTPDELNSVLRP